MNTGFWNTSVAWLVILPIGFLILFVISKVSKAVENRAEEKHSMQSKLRELELQTKRQGSIITGLCAECKTKIEPTALVCPSCGFKFVDGTYCDGCFEFYPYSELKARNDVDLNALYECKSCLNTVQRKSLSAPNRNDVPETWYMT